jgi:hypothetical protein
LLLLCFNRTARQRLKNLVASFAVVVVVGGLRL